MSESKAVLQAKTLLAMRREELRRELRQIERAMSALGSEESESVPHPPQEGRPSVRTMLVSLLEEEDRDWSAGEILSEYARRGTPIRAADPNNALRAAMADANKADQIFRVAVGRYKASKWRGSQGERVVFARESEEQEEGNLQPI